MKRADQSRQLWRFALAAAVMWTALIAVSLVWGKIEQRRGMLDHARHEAHVSSEKEMLLRFWAHGRGGSAPAANNAPPGSDLERALASAPLLREMLERNPEAAGNRNHIASLKPTESEYTADAWEAPGAPGLSRKGKPKSHPSPRSDGQGIHARHAASGERGKLRVVPRRPRLQNWRD